MMLTVLAQAPKAWAHENLRAEEPGHPLIEVGILAEIHNDIEGLFEDMNLMALGCKKASAVELKRVNLGDTKLAKFLSQCLSSTQNSHWCNELTRPNPKSLSTFQCTYGINKPHTLIHPEETTWKSAIGAVKLIKQLEVKGLKVCDIYNWWRPEPYNANVDGAPTRHPFGTSVDVHFCSNEEAIQGFRELCKFRKKGQIRAIGYYGGTGVHFGVGDRVANTWGLTCP
jgi:hypothetical protein